MSPNSNSPTCARSSSRLPELQIPLENPQPLQVAAPHLVEKRHIPINVEYWAFTPHGFQVPVAALEASTVNHRRQPAMKRPDHKRLFSARPSKYVHRQGAGGGRTDDPILAAGDKRRWGASALLVRRFQGHQVTVSASARESVRGQKRRPILWTNRPTARSFRTAFV
jgi:hypothetical protein